MKVLNFLGLRRCSLLLLLFIALPFYHLKPLGVQILMGTFFFVSWMLGRKKTNIPWYLQTFMTLGAGLYCFNQYSTLKGIAPAVSLLTLLALLQSFDLKKIKDFTVFVLICQLLLLGQLLDEFSLWFALYVLLVSIFLFVLLARFHKIIEINTAEDRFSIARRGLIRKIFIFSLPLTLILFVVFPRIPIGNVFSISKKALGKTGFTAELRPGTISEIAQDDSTYLRVKIDEGAIPMPLLYWRGGILSENRGFSWEKGKILRKSSFHFNKKVKFEYQVFLDSLESAPLFHLKGTKNFLKFSPGHRSYNPGGIIQFHPFGNHKINYVAEFSGVKSHHINRGDLKKYLQVDSSVGSKVRELAQELKGENSTLTYQNITNYFKLEGFSYTFRPGISGLEDFLFSNKLGFCEHFSSATAVLLRLNGIPSRIITGFHGGLYNPSGGYYQIRGQDAHAWLEYFNGEMWLRGDPTEVVAPERITYGFEGLLSKDEVPQGMELKDFIGMRRENFFAKIVFAWDSVYTELNQKFLNYDYKAQRDLMDFGKLRRYSSSILLFICLGLFALFTYLWRRFLYSPKLPLEKAYSRFLLKLKKVGFEKHISEGALSLENRIPRTWDSYLEASEILSLYREIKYAENTSKLDQFLTKTRSFRPAKWRGSGL
jgi:hypothetical protein